MKDTPARDSDFADLPMIRVKPVPLPEGHPDLDTFDADMAAIAKASRWLMARALWGEPKPEEHAELFDAHELGILEIRLALGLAEFDLIADDIAKWVAA